MTPLRDPLTRRDLVTLLAISPLASAQTSGTPPPPTLSADKLQKAFTGVREAGSKLRQIEIPITLEPAFIFRP